MEDYKVNFFFCIIPSAFAAFMVADSVRQGSILTKWGREYPRDKEKEGFWMVVGVYALAAVILFCYAMKWAYLWYKAR